MGRTFEERLGGTTIRIVEATGGFRGVLIRSGRSGEVIEDADRDRLLARLRNDAGTLHPHYFGYNGAKRRFRQYFPQGFQDQRFLDQERSYKLAARERLLKAAPLEAVLAGQAADLAGVSKSFQTNMLSVFEVARVAQVLRSDRGQSFVSAAARFAYGDVTRGLAEMVAVIAPHGRASWPMITYLPFLWSPQEHMFLKPEKTIDFATRVGDPFAHLYEPELRSPVYEALQQLAKNAEQQVSDMQPADRIDIQSFIWVVGDYGDAELPPAEGSAE